MRALALVALLVTLLLPAPARAEGDDAGPDDTLTRAGRILTGGVENGHHADVTLTLRDLFVARPNLGFVDGILADLLLARPTDGYRDPGGDGYMKPADRRCGRRICVHFTRTGSDKVPGHKWVGRTLDTLSRVWDAEVGDLGLRRPPSDGDRGGDGRFDVYLAELGQRGLFGYCVPERKVDGEEFAASGYCVLDNDFSRKEYDAPPGVSLRVTAAHEFFHAIQFGYDFREDPWLLESTATWVEERVSDGANDNRRYLKYGTVRRPQTPLDLFSNTRYAHYGNWAFWEYLTERIGPGIVREVWAQADATSGAPDLSSVAALRRALADDGTLAGRLTAYARANLRPGNNYREGDHWPHARITATVRVAHEPVTEVLRVDHLAAAHLVVRPQGGRKLRITVDGPPAKADPRVRVEVRRTDGSRSVRKVKLTTDGSGKLTVSLDRVASLLVTAVNASTRYRCGRGTMYACHGKPKDDNAAFGFTLQAR